MINSPAPNFSLNTLTGEQISLNEILNNGNALLVFLRHLGWIPCREHIVQLCEKQNELRKLNTSVIIISFGTLPAVQQWLKDTCPSFTVLLDRDRIVYNAYGLERSKLRSKSPRTLWLYFTRWLQRQKFHDSYGDDTSQLGGDFIVNKDGIIKFAYPSHDPTDRPTVEKLLEVLRTIKSWRQTTDRRPTNSLPSAVCGQLTYR